MISLIVTVKGLAEEREYIFDQNIVKVGRLKDNDVMLPGGNISRQQFVITLEEEEYFVTDMSSNGTRLNGEVIGRDRRRPLRNGDILETGDFHIRFQEKRPEEECEKTTDFLQAKFAQFMNQPSVTAPNPYLLVVGGPTNGTRLELSGELEEVLLGRTPDCPVQVPSPTISKHHARVIRRAGIIEIEDLSSANGTTLNGRPLTGITAMNDRDEIVLGQRGIADPIRVILSIPTAASEALPPGPGPEPAPATVAARPEHPATDVPPTVRQSEPSPAVAAQPAAAGAPVPGAAEPPPTDPAGVSPATPAGVPVSSEKVTPAPPEPVHPGAAVPPVSPAATPAATAAEPGPAKTPPAAPPPEPAGLSPIAEPGIAPETPPGQAAAPVAAGAPAPAGKTGAIPKAVAAETGGSPDKDVKLEKTGVPGKTGATPKAAGEPPPAELKTGLGISDYLIIGAAVLAALVVVAILVLFLTSK